MGKAQENEETEDPQSDLYYMADWYEKSAKTLSDKGQQHGEEAELMRTLGASWHHTEGMMTELDPQVAANYARQIVRSAEWFRSHDPTYLGGWVEDDPVILSKFVTSSGSAAAYGAMWQYDITAPEPVADLLEAPAREKETRDSVSTALRELSEPIASRFDEAWRSLYAGEKDAGHMALIAMREAMDHTVKYLSRPGQPFRGSYADQRESRIEWIARNRVNEPHKRNNLLAASNVCQKLYSTLSDLGKKRGPIPHDLARKLLIQGQDYIHLLLDACGLAG